MAGWTPGNGTERPFQTKIMAEINVTPMVDVMLVLLVIFMVTAPLLVAGVPVQLPKNSAQRISQPNKPVIVTLAADAHLYIRDEQVDAASLNSAKAFGACGRERATPLSISGLTRPFPMAR